MATANWKTDQPTNLNFLSPVNFDLLITKLPKTRYFCTGVTIPSLNFSEATADIPNAAIQASLPGDKITFDPLNLKFVVDEDMKNYQEIYNWIMQLGPGVSADDYRTLTGQANTGAFVTTPGDELKMYSDATLMINTSSNNANVEMTFVDCFPTSLGSIEFASDADDVTYAVADLTLRYTYYTIKASS
tara:strand:- start:30 stop:593 length:564 start_codon:yes stop_codon:yes gene_type:complete